MAGACHPSTEEAEAGGFCEFEDNLNYRMRLFLKKSNYETRKKEGGKREGKRREMGERVTRPRPQVSGGHS